MSSICGRNTSTPPTPAIMPSDTSEDSHAGASSHAMSALAPAPMPSFTSASIRPVRNVPIGPNVTQNITANTIRNSGKARYLFVTTRSMAAEVLP